MGGFLHHVAQISGQLQLAGAVHNVDLHLQSLAAHGGPGQAGNQADLIRTGKPVR